MTDFLSEIIALQREELELKKRQLSQFDLRQEIDFQQDQRSLKSLVKAAGESDIFIISEFKRSSPSRGDINQQADLVEVVQSYEQGGAAAVSVLTEARRFSGSLKDLALARSSIKLPILRKDFVIDSYQILEAKRFGADLILLIAEALSSSELAELIQFAHECRIEVLLEFHDLAELEKSVDLQADFLGVNSRNLRTLEVNWQHLLLVAPLLPASALKVAESGIKSAEQIIKLRAAGYRGFLIGEHLMQSNNPRLACQELLNSVRAVEREF